MTNDPTLTELRASYEKASQAYALSGDALLAARKAYDGAVSYLAVQMASGTQEAVQTAGRLHRAALDAKVEAEAVDARNRAALAAADRALDAALLGMVKR